MDNAANYVKAEIDRRILEPALGSGLITSEGETWQKHRRMMTPFFDQQSIAGIAPVIVESAENLVASWQAMGEGQTIDVAEAMTRLTLRIISRAMFSLVDDEIAMIVEKASAEYQAEIKFGLPDIVPGLNRLAGIAKQRRGRRIFRELDRAIHRLILSRETARDGAPNDLLARLMAARDPDGAGMTSGQIRDQIVTIFLAGHETTAQLQTWSWYLLSLHPENEAKFHAELDMTLAGRTPGYDISRLSYTRMVLEESARLYPPVFALAWRKALADDVICGRNIPKGAIVSIVPWVLHRQQRLWENPDQFDPGRFSTQGKSGRPRFAYLPFSTGPRTCIGAGFAMTEAVLVLATLGRHFRLKLADNQTVEPQALITLRPRGGMKMTVWPRCGA